VRLRQGLARRLQTSQDLFEQKAFYIRQSFAFHPAKAGKNILHGEMQNYHFRAMYKPNLPTFTE